MEFIWEKKIKDNKNKTENYKTPRVLGTNEPRNPPKSTEQRQLISEKETHGESCYERRKEGRKAKSKNIKTLKFSFFLLPLPPASSSFLYLFFPLLPSSHAFWHSLRKTTICKTSAKLWRYFRVDKKKTSVKKLHLRLKGY